MKYSKIWLYTSVGSGISLFLVVVFYFFIEAYGDGFGAGLLALLLAIVNLVSLIYSSKAGYHKIAFGQGLLIVLFVISIFFSVSRTVLFGSEVARVELGQDFGFQNLIFYNRGICVIERGGMGGINEINYCSYIKEGTTFYVPQGWTPYLHTEVQIDETTYTVEDSDKVSGLINHRKLQPLN